MLKSTITFFSKLFGRITLAAVQLFVLGVLTWSILRVFPGDRLLPVRLGSYFLPWILIALLPTLLIAIVSRRRWTIGFTLLALLLVASRFSYLLIPQVSPASADFAGSQLRVMTFNVHYANRNVDGITELILTEQPDIIAVQELTPQLGRPLFSRLKNEYPYYLTGGNSSVIISRYPLTKQLKPYGTGRSERAIINTPLGEIGLWNVHPPTAVRQGGWEAQNQFFSLIANEIKNETGPMIVLGDFNSTDQAENYQLISNQLTSVHHAVGNGFGFTYPDPSIIDTIGIIPRLGPISLKPIVHIDHIFVSDHFTPLETHIIPHGYGSDHRPVVATLQVKP